MDTDIFIYLFLNQRILVQTPLAGCKLETFPRGCQQQIGKFQNPEEEQLSF